MTEGLCVGAFIRALCGLSNPHITHGKKLFDVNRNSAFDWRTPC